MTYSDWFYAHGNKHKEIMDKLIHLNMDEVIEYFRFDNMVKNEPDFCPLFKDNKKCHDIPGLNCYLCACPHFKFRDNGFSKREEKMLFSVCSINSKEGGQFISDDAIHQDCSQCYIPHRESFIRKMFDRDWFEIMENCV